MKEYSEQELVVIALGALLHDIGKPIQRADNNPTKQNHQSFGKEFFERVLEEENSGSGYYLSSIIQSIRLHHGKAGEGPWTSKDSYIPWLVYEADNLASAHDRKSLPFLYEKDGSRLDETDNSAKDKFNPKRRLNSIFTALKTRGETTEANSFDLWFRTRLENGKREIQNLPYPQRDLNSSTIEQYQKITIELKNIIEKISRSSELDIDLVNQVSYYLEELFQFIPPDTYTGHTNDVSLYDHLKLTAAIASCLFIWLKENHHEWFENYTATPNAEGSPWHKIKTEIRDKSTYILMKADISGIQDFIYNIASKRALKALRGRSFYLEVLVNQIADEILKTFFLSRCNLIYSGGGGFALLLPNTSFICSSLIKIEESLNKFLFDKYDGKLSLALGWSELTGNDLRTNAENENHPLNQAWKKIAGMISEKKMRKFNSLLTEIFTSKKDPLVERKEECSICHKEISGSEKERITDESSSSAYYECLACQEFEDLGKELTSEGLFKFIPETKDSDEIDEYIFPEVYIEDNDYKIRSLKLFSCEEKDSKAFAINNSNLYIPPKLYWSQAVAKNSKGEIKEFSDLALASETGVERIAVLRADVDNLGKVFTGQDKAYGIKPDLKSISRDASLSKNIAKFFTHYLDELLKEFKDITVVYSGGDDLFLVGHWEQVIYAALKIEERFHAYTLGTLSISAGISIHPPKYPLYRMAKDSGRAEKLAKTYNKSIKNSLCVYFDDNIFRPRNPSYVFTWKEWREDVLRWKTQLAELDLSTALLYDVNTYLKKLLESENAYDFPRLLYRIARYEKEESLSDSDSWLDFKEKIFNLCETSQNDEHQNKEIRYIETAINWHLLRHRIKKNDKEILNV